MYMFRFSIIFLLVIIQSTFSNTVHAQGKIEGQVVEENDTPIPYASVKLADHNEGIVSDTAGRFLLRIHGASKNDTIIISSIGFEPLKIPVANVAKKGRYILKSFSTKMESVVVRSFGKEDIAGAKTDIVGYYRSWSTTNKGGEIGRAIHVPHKEYQVSRVRFKLFSTCDTAIVRLHIREMNGLSPGKELLQDSVALPFYNTAVAGKTYDFDLSKYNLILNRKEIFVSFEVLKGSSGSEYCSLSFAGSEQGRYIYKTSKNEEWDYTDDYTIYLKVFFRYD